jgi:hypothetical protein
VIGTVQPAGRRGGGVVYDLETRPAGERPDGEEAG